MVLYFTGTGNSRFTAERIASALREPILDLFTRIKTGDTAPLSSDTPWIVVCPTYAWQIPHIIRDHLLKTELSGSRKIYFVMTCGDDIGNAGKYAKKLCGAKGLSFMGCAAVAMPENYIAMFSAPGTDKAKHIIGKALPVIDNIIDIIRNGEKLSYETKAVDALKSSVVNTVFCGFMVRDKKFTVSGSCTGCGRCASVCPSDNITMTDKKPQWNGKCIHCMACITSCPAEAIEYGKKSIGQPRYRCPGV